MRISKVIDIYPKGEPDSFRYAGPMFARSKERANEYMDAGQSFAVTDIRVLDQSRFGEYDEVLLHDAVVDLKSGMWRV